MTTNAKIKSVAEIQMPQKYHMDGMGCHYPAEQGAFYFVDEIDPAFASLRAYAEQLEREKQELEAKLATTRPWWDDNGVLKYSELYRKLRSMPVILNPFSGRQIHGALLDHYLTGQILRDSPDGKLPWEITKAAPERTKKG